MKNIDIKPIINAKKFFERSPFYREKLEAYKGIFYKNNDWNEIPFTSKKEILFDQELFPPFGKNLTVNIDKILRVHKTSGTTNNPLIICLTKKDIKNTIKIGANCFISAGLKKSDIVINCLNYNMWAGGYTDHQSLENTGACVVPFGIGNSVSLIETIKLIKPTAIHCTPSYLKRLEIILNEKFNMKPQDLDLKLGLFGAESGLQNPLFRETIEKIWGLKAMNANYGLSEVMSMLASECLYQKGLHFQASEYVYAELIDPKTLLNIKIEKDAEGELVLTNLYKEAQPLIRYRTNDIVKILNNEKCECGFEGFTFEVLGRSDDMLVIKGINIFISSIENILLEFKDINIGSLRVYVNKGDPIDKIQIHIQSVNSSINTKKTGGIIVNKIKDSLNISPEIFFYTENNLEPIENKSKKLFKTL